MPKKLSVWLQTRNSSIGIERKTSCGEALQTFFVLLCVTLNLTWLMPHYAKGTVSKHDTAQNRTVYNYRRYPECCTTTCVIGNKKGNWQRDREGLVAD